MISNGYSIDLTKSKICQTLGFSVDTIISSDGINEGDVVPDFNNNVNQIQIRTSLLSPNASNFNGISAPILYAFNPIGRPYSFMNIIPSVPIYLPMNGRSIENINIKITDQDGRLLFTGGERTSIVLNIRSAS